MSTPSEVDTKCPRCQTLITPAEALLTCSACGVAYHQACWEAWMPCQTPECTGKPTAPPPATREALMPAAYDAHPQPQSLIPTATPFMPPPPPPPLLATGMPGVNGIWTAPQPIIAMEGEKTLIVQSGCELPPVCIVTSKKDDLLKRKRTESWGPSWLLIIVLLSPLIAAIVYICIKKSATITFYLPPPTVPSLSAPDAPPLGSEDRKQRHATEIPYTGTGKGHLSGLHCFAHHPRVKRGFSCSCIDRISAGRRVGG